MRDPLDNEITSSGLSHGFGSRLRAMPINSLAKVVCGCAR